MDDTVLKYVQQLESDAIAWLNWPKWAMRTVEVLSSLIGMISLLQYLLSSKEKKSTKQLQMESSDESKKNTREFFLFQVQYLSVYLTIMCADWLQGTHMYTLYASYKMDIGTLFLTGFLSSAVFGTFLGIYVDKWGRRFGCLLFCVLEIIINTMEHIPNMQILLVGRVLGGLSTSLLFSAFESWMVSEHRKRGFPEDWLAGTFAISSWGNGVVAIVAGFLAHFAADVGGDIGPFQLAIGLTIVSLVLIVTWDENYGDAHGSSKGPELESGSSFLASINSTLSLTMRYPAVLCLGLSQAFFEGGVYTFVFMWVPSMLELMPPGGQALPTGLVFACFMLAMTLGGMIFALLLPVFPGGCISLAAFVFAVAAGTMAVPIFHYEFWWVFIAFLVLECMLGMFASCGGTLRSIYYPEGMQSSIMSMFRLPLNLLVVLGTLLTNNASNVDELKHVYKVVSGMHLIALFFHLCVAYFPIPCESQLTSTCGSPHKSKEKSE